MACRSPAYRWAGKNAEGGNNLIVEQIHQELRLFLTTGLLGGFTTFSAFSLDLALMWERGQTWPAIAYATASVGVSLLAVFSRLALTRTLLS